jgi:hypothetical protein
VNISDFEGTIEVECVDDLLSRLYQMRFGQYGMFILSHGGETSLWLHINRDVAFLWYLPRQQSHPGYVPDGMWLGEQKDVQFLLVGGDEGNAIWVAWWQLLAVDAAYGAAVEYFQSQSLPPSVNWFEL